MAFNSIQKLSRKDTAMFCSNYSIMLTLEIDTLHPHQPEWIQIHSSHLFRKCPSHMAFVEAVPFLCSQECRICLACKKNCKGESISEI